VGKVAKSNHLALSHSSYMISFYSLIVSARERERETLSLPCAALSCHHSLSSFVILSSRAGGKAECGVEVSLRSRQRPFGLSPKAFELYICLDGIALLYEIQTTPYADPAAAPK
jgi:hypothetical protein